ncbi:MAG: D-lyxose/D-mannose family sugar isomerase [Verrucomicrobia bacterium]|nr:MAG: D-lyxose/D-mannose family sugar isomerase [Verrucomicrobiota bacterium]
MKRSEINRAFREASACFSEKGWALPPEPRWDMTDFGLGRFWKSGLVLINLAEEPEYCEKLMFAVRNQITPLHAHRLKKEDIICRHGGLAIELWADRPDTVEKGSAFFINVNGQARKVASGETVHLSAGERITLTPGVVHAFWPDTETCIIGEVSTANDDANDNFFVNPEIGRFPEIEEDEPSEITLISEPLRGPPQ